MNETLFWKVFRNKYIRNVLFENLQNMKLSFVRLESFYLGNRKSFKYIRSLSFISKRSAWSILYDKVKTDEFLLIKKTSIIKFFAYCKDFKLIELVYCKYRDQFTQLDLILHFINSNNYEALELFTMKYRDELPTTKQSMDTALDKYDLNGGKSSDDQYFKTLELLRIYRNEGCTKERVFKNRGIKVIGYLLDHPDIYNGIEDYSLITFNQFNNVPCSIQLKMLELKLIQKEDSLQSIESSISQRIQDQGPPLSIIDFQTISSYLFTFYSINELFGNGNFQLISKCVMVGIGNSILVNDYSKFKEFIKLDNQQIDYQTFWNNNMFIDFGSPNIVFTHECSIELIKICSSKQMDKLQHLDKLLPIIYKYIQFNNIYNAISLYDEINNSNRFLVLFNFYNNEIIKPSNLQLLNEFIPYVSYSSIQFLQIINFKNLDYFSSSFQSNEQQILSFIDRLLGIPSFIICPQFLNSLKKLLHILPNTPTTFIESLVKVNKINQSLEIRNLINIQVIQLLKSQYENNDEQVYNFIISKFINNFKQKDIIKILNFNFHNCNFNKIKVLLNHWNGSVKYIVITTNIKIINYLISNCGTGGTCSNWFLKLNFNYLLDNFIKYGCSLFDQNLEFIDKIITFKKKFKLYQPNTKLISVNSISISYDLGYIHIIQLIYNNYKSLFQWPKSLKSQIKSGIINNLTITQTNSTNNNNNNKRKKRTIPIIISNLQQQQPTIDLISTTIIFNENRQQFSKCEIINIKTLPRLITQNNNNISITPFSFNSNKFRNSLIRLLDYGEVQDALYFYKKHMRKAIESSSTTTDTTLKTTTPTKKKSHRNMITDSLDKISNNQLFTILKCYKYELVIEYSKIYHSEFRRSPTQYILFHALKKARIDVYEYLLSLNPDNHNKINDLIIRIGERGGDIPIIKYLLSHQLFKDNTKEFEKQFVLNELLLTSVRQSNINLCKWLLSNDNQYSNLIQLYTNTDYISNSITNISPNIITISFKLYFNNLNKKLQITCL